MLKSLLATIILLSIVSASSAQQSAKTGPAGQASESL